MCSKNNHNIYLKKKTNVYLCTKNVQRYVEKMEFLQIVII